MTIPFDKRPFSTFLTAFNCARYRIPFTPNIFLKKYIKINLLKDESGVSEVTWRPVKPKKFIRLLEKEFIFGKPFLLPALFNVHLSLRAHSRSKKIMLINWFLSIRTPLATLWTAQPAFHIFKPSFWLNWYYILYWYY